MPQAELLKRKAAMPAQVCQSTAYTVVHTVVRGVEGGSFKVYCQFGWIKRQLALYRISLLAEGQAMV